MTEIAPAAAMGADPIVRVGPVIIPGGACEDVELPDTVAVTCTAAACGGSDEIPEYLGDWYSVNDRDRAISLAAVHAEREHDGLVVARGWTR